MDLGPLDQRILVERKTTTKDPDYGTEVVTPWVEVATLWASMQDVLPSKAEEAGDGIRVLTRPCRIRTRYVTGITSDMRLTWLERSRVMQIVSGPAELGRKEGLEFMAQEYSTVGAGA